MLVVSLENLYVYGLNYGYEAGFQDVKGYLTSLFTKIQLWVNYTHWSLDTKAFLIGTHNLCSYGMRWPHVAERWKDAV